MLYVFGKIGGPLCQQEEERLEASYDGLIAVWSERTRQATAIHDTRGDLQGSLEF